MRIRQIIHYMIQILLHVSENVRIMLPDKDTVLNVAKPTSDMRMGVGAPTEYPVKCRQLCGCCSLTDSHLKVKAYL
jgi:hypothetical protein